MCQTFPMFWYNNKILDLSFSLANFSLVFRLLLEQKLTPFTPTMKVKLVQYLADYEGTHLHLGNVLNVLY